MTRTRDLLITNQLLYRLSYSGISDGLSLSTTSDLFLTNHFYFIKQYHWANTYNIISQFLIKRNKKHHEQNQNTMLSYALLSPTSNKIYPHNFFLKTSYVTTENKMYAIVHFTFDFLPPYYQRISINKESQRTSKVLCNSPIHLLL